MKKGKILFKNIISLSSAISALGITLLVLLVVFDVFLRHSIKSAIPGAVGFSSIILAIIVFFGLGPAQAKKEHIRVEIFIDKLFPYKGNRRHFLELLVNLTAIIFFAIILWESIDAFIVSYNMKEYYGGAPIRVPIYPARGALLVGCAIIIGQLFKDILEILIKNKK
uniref:TRAP transporter small permease n=1 Tax=candidate division CPR3 bacterium TaxID=2268181 RepID=A0A7V3J9X2_UNCC3